MDENLLNFWKNYEDVINWGYRISGARRADDSELRVPTNSQMTEMQSDTHFNEKQYESDDSDSSVDIDLEYLKFSKKTLEHQEKIEKEKREVDKEYGLCNSPSSENEYSKITFLEEIDPKKFYGSKMNDIERLEKKLQTEFDTFCLTKKPVLWPGMAFNLSVPVTVKQTHQSHLSSNHLFAYQ